jgi:hypothetical protein
MTVWRRRGSESRSGRRPGRGRRRWLLLSVLAATALTTGGPAVFVATQCWGSGPAPAASAAAPPPVSGRVEASFERPSPGTAAAQLYSLGLTRGEARSYLTLPSRLVVYSADDRAEWLTRRPPSGYPYFGSIKQYWAGYNAVCEVTSREHAFTAGDHVALAAAGAAFSVEYTLTGLWENTIGRATEWISAASRTWRAGAPTPEDAFAIRTAREYAAFIHKIPWYDFPYGDRLLTLWNGSPLWGPNVIRKWDRRIVLTAEYGLKGIAALIARQVASPAAADGGASSSLIYAAIDQASPTAFADERIREFKPLGPRSYIVSLPPREGFTETVRELQAKGVRFLSIAGNDDILLTAIAPHALAEVVPLDRRVATLPLLTDPLHTRLALRVRITALSEVLGWLATRGASIEAIHGY